MKPETYIPAVIMAVGLFISSERQVAANEVTVEQLTKSIDSLTIVVQANHDLAIKNEVRINAHKESHERYDNYISPKSGH